jgi:peptidoglycan hydrolase-like protein with peptidoglycan-binding domain
MDFLKLNTVVISAATLLGIGVVQAGNLVPDTSNFVPSIASVMPSKAASGNSQPVMSVARTAIVKRGVLLSVGQAAPSVGDIASNLQRNGFGNATAKDTGDSTTYAIGYRHPIRNRWSVDTTYIDQGEISASVEAAPAGGKTAAQTAKDVALSLPIYGSGINVVGLRHFPVGQRFSAQAGAGAFIWGNEREATVDSVRHVEKENGINAMVQLGFSYKINQRVSVELAGQRFFMSGDDVDRLSLGVSIGF